MADFTQIFGDSNIIQLDGTITRGRINPDIFSFNSKPVVIRSKADLVRQSTSNTLVVPSTKGISRPISKPPQSTFSNKPIVRQTDLPPLVQKISTKSVAVIDRETKQISEIQPINFRKRGEILLKGGSDTNQIRFDKYELDDIIGVANTSFQFILRLITSEGEFYYTSADFKNKLESDNLNNLPYRIIEALNPSSVVTVDVRNILNSIGTEYANEERKAGAFVTFNTFVSADGNIDNTKLVEYINWVVSKPPQEYDNRIIPAETLGSWSIIGGVDRGDGISVAKSSGTALPTKDQISDTISEPIIQNPKPIKRIPTTPASEVFTKSDKPIVNPKPRGSGLAELPILRPGPNMFSGISTPQQNAVARNFTSIVGGGSLVPQTPIYPTILNDLTGIDWSGINSERVRKPRNIL